MDMQDTAGSESVDLVMKLARERRTERFFLRASLCALLCELSLLALLKPYKGETVMSTLVSALCERKHPQTILAVKHRHCSWHPPVLIHKTKKPEHPIDAEVQP